MDTVESLQKKINDVKAQMKEYEKIKLIDRRDFDNERQCQLDDELLELKDKLAKLQK